MALNLADYENKTRKAVKQFWCARKAAGKKQNSSANQDQGERSKVTAGKNMDGFVALIREIVKANGLTNADIKISNSALTLPGFFRPTKRWDILVIHKETLIAAIEMKSQVGPSFGNNFNNRAEEAIGTAKDFWTAFRDGAFGDCAQPFAGWLMLVEDAPASRAPVNNKSPNFSIFPEFNGTSYIDRYNLLCKKLMKEKLYTSAALITSPKKAYKNGAFTSMDKMTGVDSFVCSLASHIAARSCSKA